MENEIFASESTFLSVMEISDKSYKILKKTGIFFKMIVSSFIAVMVGYLSYYQWNAETASFLQRQKANGGLLSKVIEYGESLYGKEVIVVPYSRFISYAILAFIVTFAIMVIFGKISKKKDDILYIKNPKAVQGKISDLGCQVFLVIYNKYFSGTGRYKNDLVVHYLGSKLGYSKNFLEANINIELKFDIKSIEKKLEKLCVESSIDYSKLLGKIDDLGEEFDHVMQLNDDKDVNKSFEISISSPVSVG